MQESWFGVKNLDCLVFFKLISQIQKSEEDYMAKKYVEDFFFNLT